VAAAAYDAAHTHPDEAVRQQNQAFYEFLVPLIKGLSTEMSLDVASLGVQVHGGMGFIEETGAAQYLRDAKILTIYEGTTAIQANDLVGRKTARDGGQVARAIAGRSRPPKPNCQRAPAWPAARWPSATGRGTQGLPGRGGLRHRPDQGAAQRRVCRQRALPDAGRHRVAGWQMARALMAAEDQLAAGEDTDFMRPRSPPRASTGTTSSTRRRRCATASSKAPSSVTALALEAF
jgi:hypothetical protein